jgi:AcrR family transcriptional regulator
MAEPASQESAVPVAPRRPLARRPANARERTPEGAKVTRSLLDAALTVYGRRGYQQTRVDDIAAAASVSHGTFYLYFRNKEDLLHRLAGECAQDMDSLIAALLALRRPPGEAALTAWLRDFVRTYRRYGPILRIWFEGHDPDPLMQSLADDVLSRLSAGVEELIRDQLPARADPMVAAFATVGMLDRVGYYLLSSPDSADEDSVVETLSRMIGGLARPPR